MRANPHNKATPMLALAALGVVFGDIGTSPLYALKAVVAALGGALSPLSALESLSLIIWTLIVTLTIKYCGLVMRADNHGEGGILALMALAGANRLKGTRGIFAVIGLLGAALLYGDGVITPAISVLSALEGLKTAAPMLERFILPLALVILTGLFLIQRFGAGRLGAAFGPVMLVWFLTIAVLGAVNVAQNPAVLKAFNPYYVLAFFQRAPMRAFLAMGGVFLCVTGGEALYADMGHFGRGPVRAAWLAIAFPSLLLNYAGQVGHLLDHPAARTNPFFAMAPGWAIYPLVGLATLATIIASQAIITGVFSLTRQAIQLGWMPGMTIRQTAQERYGQIYVPAMNVLMAIGTLALTLVFQSSDRLAGAYGMAVAGTMLLTTLLLMRVMHKVWKWPPALIAGVAGLFLLVDGGYFAANLTKLVQGGWIPLSLAALMLIVMTSWRTGTDILHRKMIRASREKCFRLLRSKEVPRVPGTAVFLTRARQTVPSLLYAHIRHMGALQETAIALTVTIVERPWVSEGRRARAKYLDHGVWRVTAYFGFMEEPDLLRALEGIEALDQVDFTKVIYFGARDLIKRDEKHPEMGRLRLALFSFLLRNAVKTMDHFDIPPENFVEIAREARL
jgi:KUP system potassium uptake protein